MSDFSKELKALERAGGCPGEGAFLAGGAITSVFTNEPIRDFDFYFESYGAFKAALDKAYDDGGWCVGLSRRAITFGAKCGSPSFQLMFFGFFPQPEDIFSSFDFTCCMAALRGGSKTLSFHARFLADVAKRELVFNHKTAFPIASGLRVRKYLERGYTITADEWLKVLLACRFSPAATWRELQDQIGGHYGEAIHILNTDDSVAFTLDNAIAALSKVREKDNQFMLEGAEVEAPTNFEDAIARIDKIRSEV